MVGLTPMMEQYISIKKEHKEAILFFRLGDFYEMFFEDAEIASKILEITLTSREGGKGNRIPMCGIPFHAADNYIGKLIEAGLKVAICEQVEDPKATKGIVKREVIRTITPGTHIELNSLNDKANNYLISIVHLNNSFGLSAVDVSTGLFLVTEISGKDAINKLFDEIARLQPKEGIFSPDFLELEHVEQLLRQYPNLTYSTYHHWAFSYEHAFETLTKHFQTHSLDGFGCSGLTLAVKAAGALLDYINETQKIKLIHINNLKTYSTDQYMNLDASTRRNLELTKTIRDGSAKGTLLWILDYTVTAMGGRLLKSWLEQPLINPQEVEKRLNANQELIDNIFLRSDIRNLLKEVYDLERLIGRIAYGTANAKDLLALKKSISILPQILEHLTWGQSPLIIEIYKLIDPLIDIYKLLDLAINEDPPFSLREGGLIKEKYNEYLDQLHLASREGKNWIAKLEGEEKERTGIKSLKVGFNKVFGYYIEITNANRGNVPDDYIRKQTLSNAERFITPALKEYESMILGAEDKIVQLEYELFVEIRKQLETDVPRIQKTAGALAQLDALISLAEAALKGNYVKPTISIDGVLDIKGGRHPVVESMLRDQWFVPNDTYLNNQDNQIGIITGPNMAGKSTYMRQTALIVLMAQIGSFVPAESAQIGIVDRIFTRVGASDDLAMGQSTFMVEMNEVANILNNATSNSLVILDEIGRGTSTFDGLSIAWAVVEYLHHFKGIGAKTLFATHYHELTELEEILPGVKNYSIAVKEQGDDIIFLRKIINGGTDRSYGIQVARLAGLPQIVIQRAKEILLTLECQEDIGKEQRETYSILATDNNNLAASGIQTSIFPEQPKHHPVLDELKKIDLMTLTPIEAMNIINRLQQKIKEDVI